MIHNSKFLENLGKVIVRFPNAELTDVFSKGQLESKKWLVNKILELNLELGTVFLCAGWYGILAAFLFEANVKLKKIRSFDINPECEQIADTFNKNWEMDHWKFKASTLDILSMEYPLTYITHNKQLVSSSLTDMPDTIINTSCEHIKDFKIWYEKIPTGTLLVLQSNNFFEIAEHVNCSKSIEDFSRITPMAKVLYQGDLHLEKYTRFMKIGIK